LQTSQEHFSTEDVQMGDAPLMMLAIRLRFWCSFFMLTTLHLSHSKELLDEQEEDEEESLQLSQSQLEEGFEQERSMCFL